MHSRCVIADDDVKTLQMERQYHEKEGAYGKENQRTLPLGSNCSGNHTTGHEEPSDDNKDLHGATVLDDHLTAVLPRRGANTPEQIVHSNGRCCRILPLQAFVLPYRPR